MPIQDQIVCPQCDSTDALPINYVMWECKECGDCFAVKPRTNNGSGQIAGKVFHRGMKWGASLA
jgi:ribosomal protein L37AE/L43A